LKLRLFIVFMLLDVILHHLFFHLIVLEFMTLKQLSSLGLKLFPIRFYTIIIYTSLVLVGEVFRVLYIVGLRLRGMRAECLINQFL
jgi:hypothetical protein